MKKILFACRTLIPALGLMLAVQTSGPAAETTPYFKEGKSRVLIFSGRNNHDWRKTTPYLKGLLEKSGRFDVRITQEPAGITAGTLEPYDLIVLDYMGPRWGAVTEQAVLEFVRGGRGLVAVHGANYAFSGLELLGDSHVRLGEFEPPWHEYAKMIGGVWIQGPPKTAHGDRHSFKVRYIDREHPVAAGLEETFIATDELYHNVQMEPAARVLATAFSDPATRGTGRDEPVLWSVDYGKGRVFYTALGHDLTAMCEPGFAVSFVRGCEWASKGEVALEPGTILDERREEKVKALLVTGGHGFDTEFYGVFDLDRLAWDHAFTPSEAYKSDFRDKYDVLVLYDLTHEIDDNGKKNLRAFVESGKGLVVLHHAIADYNSWPWWWREVVGGKYLMEPDGEMPASTYIHDLELFLRPVGEHSITAGLGPMHIQDETYKGMWISPEVKVIMETDEETSDGPVAWISPYEKSRVVYVQLGHDRKAHVHPGYRKLVQRAILWAAGRLE